MGTSLEQPRRATLPIVKYTGIGQTLHAVLVNAEQRDQQKKEQDGTWVTVLKTGGQPRKEEILTYLVLEGDAQLPVPGTDDTRPVEPGELVRYIYKGRKWGQRIEAYKDLDGGMQVGDHHTITVTGACAVNAEGIIPDTDCTTDEQVLKQRMKGRNISYTLAIDVRRAKEDESDLVEEAEAQHAALKPRPVREPVGLEPQQWDDEEEPF